MRLFLLLSLLLISTPAFAGVNNITEEDGSPSIFPWKMKFSNGSVTDNGDGTASISGGGSGTPGTPISSVQTNQGSAFSGDQSLVWDKDNNTLSISRDVGQTGLALRISSDTGTTLFNISHDGSMVVGLGGAGANLGVGSTISMDAGTGSIRTSGNITSTAGTLTSSGAVAGTSFTVSGTTILTNSTISLNSTTNATLSNISATAGSTTLIRGGTSTTSGVTIQSTSNSAGVGDVIAFKDGANGGTTAMTITGPNGRVRISTDIVSMDATTGTAQLNLFGTTGGCIMLRDTNNGGYTKCTALTGTLTCATDADGQC